MPNSRIPLLSTASPVLRAAGCAALCRVPVVNLFDSFSLSLLVILALTNLQELNLSGTGITDKELLPLSGIHHQFAYLLPLQSLTLPPIAGLTRLERLQLRSCNITDCGLATLAGTRRRQFFLQ